MMMLWIVLAAVAPWVPLAPWVVTAAQAQGKFLSKV